MVKLILDCLLEEKKWKKYIAKKTIQIVVLRILECIFFLLKVKNTENLSVELSITFTNDSGIKHINSKYRNIDKSTNVLSFPIYEKEFFDIIEKENYVFLGDIILSLETMLKESEEENVSFNYHLNHLITHSLLHLLGFDHQDSLDAEKMERLERSILERIRL